MSQVHEIIANDVFDDEETFQDINHLSEDFQQKNVKFNFNCNFFSNPVQVVGFDFNK